MKRLAFAIIACAWAFTAQAEVIYLPTPEGAQRFQRSAAEPQALSLLSYVESEERLTFCGPASLAAVLNSLGMHEPTPDNLYPFHLVTQGTVFIPANQAVKSYGAVEQDGLTLDQLGQFAHNMGLQVEAIHADAVPADELRRKVQAALGVANTRVIINYSRIPVGQEGDGHFSPIAAYDPKSDSFLVLDVSRYKYTPAWISFDQLRAAMLRVDTSSNKARGILIVQRP